MAGWIKMPMGMETGPSPGENCVRWGLSSPWKGYSPQFLAHVYCGQTSGCINMALGMEVYLGPDHIVFMGTQLPPLREGTAATPLFGPCLFGPLLGRSSPYCRDMWSRYCCLTSFFSDCRYVPQLRRYSPTKLCACAQMAIFGNFFASCIFSEPRAGRFRPAF